MTLSRKGAFGIIETLLTLGILATIAVLLAYFLQPNKLPVLILQLGSDCQQQAQSIINHINSFNKDPQIRNIQPSKVNFSTNFWIDPHPQDVLYTPDKTSALLRDSIVYFGNNPSGEMNHPTPNSPFEVYTVQQIRNATTWAINLYNNHIKETNSRNICSNNGIAFKRIDLAQGGLSFTDLNNLLPGNINLEVNEEVESIYLKIGLIKANLNGTDLNTHIINCGSPIALNLSDTSGVFLQVMIESADLTARANGNAQAVKQCTAQTLLNYNAQNISGSNLNLLSPPSPLQLITENGRTLQGNACTCPTISGCGTSHLQVSTPVLSFNQPGVSFVCRTSGPSFNFSSHPTWMSCHALGAAIQMTSPPYDSNTEARIIFSNLTESDATNTLEIKAVGIDGRVAQEFENLAAFQFRIKTPSCQPPHSAACGQPIPDDCGGFGECGVRQPICPSIVCSNHAPTMSDCGTICAPNTNPNCAPPDTVECGQVIPDLSGCGATCPGVGTQNCPPPVEEVPPPTTTVSCTPNCADPTTIPCGSPVPDNNGCTPNTCGVGTLNCATCVINCAPANTIACNLPIPDLNNCPGFQAGLTCPGVGTLNCTTTCSVSCANPGDVACGQPIPDLNNCPNYQEGVTCTGVGTKGCPVPPCALGLDENGKPVCPGSGEAQRLYSQGLCTCS